MRKYQQLLLAILSCASIIIVLVYKSENNKLKYVLSVVNFLGHSDNIIMKMQEDENNGNLNIAVTQPLPMWQVIGNDFHAYSLFWSSNGGDAIALVTAKSSAIVDFTCFLIYKETKDRVKGNFHFQMLNEFEEGGDNGNFKSYIFSCNNPNHTKLNIVERVQFREKSSKSNDLQDLFVYYPDNKKGKVEMPLKTVTICLDLINTRISKDINNEIQSTILKQFLVHHSILGIKDIIIYTNEIIPFDVLNWMKRLRLNIVLLPFNFAFSYKNASNQLRNIIKADCLMRNMHVSTLTIILEGDEYFYTKSKIIHNSSLLSFINENINTDIYEFSSYPVCIDQSKKFLIDNSLYDPDSRLNHKIQLYKPKYYTENKLNNDNRISKHIPISLGFIHKYSDCIHVGKDGLYEFRNILDNDFRNTLHNMRNEIHNIL